MKNFLSKLLKGTKKDIEKNLSSDLDIILPEEDNTDRSASKHNTKFLGIHMDKANNLFQLRKYKASMDELIQILDVYPKDQNALDLAQNILYLSNLRDSPEKLAPSIIHEPLLDNLYFQCNKCHSKWVPNAVYKLNADVRIMNPIGGVCPKCNKVWCRNCTNQSSMLFYCPDCQIELKHAIIPNGRKRGLLPAKHPELKLLHVFLYKTWPEPRNIRSYIMVVLDTLCPDALQGCSPQIHYDTIEKDHDQSMALAIAFSTAGHKNIEINTDFFFNESFNDSDGGKGFLFTLYEPK